MKQQITHEVDYSFYLVNIECMPTSRHFNVVMELERSIEPLFPYLASELPGCTYIHGSGVINLVEGGHIIGFYPHRITITDVDGSAAAADLCRHYYRKILEVEGSRDRIPPLYEKRVSVNLLDILRALPGTNCGECGLPTCMAFAAQVLRREALIEKCKPLTEAITEQKTQQLMKKLAANGWQVPTACGSK